MWKNMSEERGAYHADNRYDAWLEEQLSKAAQERDSAQAEARKTMERRMTAVRRQMQVLADLRTKEEIDPEDYRVRYNALVAERTSLDQKLSQLGDKGNIWSEPARRAFSLLKLAKNRMETGTSDEKRAILYAVGQNPQLKDGKLLISAKKPLQLLLERSQFPVWQGQTKDIRTFWKRVAHAFRNFDIGPIEQILSNKVPNRGTG